MPSPPPGWISRSQTVARLGLSLSTFRRRVGSWKLHEQVLEGEYFYLASEIDERRRLLEEAEPAGGEMSRSGGQEEQSSLAGSDLTSDEEIYAQPRSGSDSLQELGVEGIICSKVYALLEQGKSRVDIVRLMGIFPRVADAIASEWERQRRVVSIPLETFCKIKQLAADCNCEEDSIDGMLEALRSQSEQHRASKKEYDEFYQALMDLGENHVLVERKFAPTTQKIYQRAVCDLISDAWNVAQPSPEDLRPNITRQPSEPNKRFHPRTKPAITSHGSCRVVAGAFGDRGRGRGAGGGSRCAHRRPFAGYPRQACEAERSAAPGPCHQARSWQTPKGCGTGQACQQEEARPPKRRRAREAGRAGGGLCCGGSPQKPRGGELAADRCWGTTPGW